MTLSKFQVGQRFFNDATAQNLAECETNTIVSMTEKSLKLSCTSEYFGTFEVVKMKTKVEKLINDSDWVVL